MAIWGWTESSMVPVAPADTPGRGPLPARRGPWVRLVVCSTEELADDQDMPAPMVMEACAPTTIVPERVRDTGIFGNNRIGTGPAWMSMGGESISPICQVFFPETVAVRPAFAPTVADADIETPFGIPKLVWTSASIFTWACKFT